MAETSNDQRMRRLAQWMAEQWGRAPFFAGVTPFDRQPPVTISNVNVPGQISMLRGFLGSFEHGRARLFVQAPAAIASDFQVEPDDVRTVVRLLRHEFAPRESTPLQVERVCSWLEAWLELVERGR